MNVLFALIMSWMSFASAAESIGRVNCYTLNRPVSHMIHADIIGTRSDKEWTVEYANINLTSYNWSTHVETAPLKIWQAVPSMNDRNFSEHFKNQDVELEAFHDDAGAMSFISYEGKVYQLICEVEIY